MNYEPMTESRAAADLRFFFNQNIAIVYTYFASRYIFSASVLDCDYIIVVLF